MKDCTRRRYYIYGIALTSDDIVYIDWIETSPGEMRDNILFELERLPGKALGQVVSQLKRSRKGEIFELETFLCKEEAIQAVEFWRINCRFLGLNLVNGFDGLAL